MYFRLPRLYFRCCTNEAQGSWEVLTSKHRVYMIICVHLIYIYINVQHVRWMGDVDMPCPWRIARQKAVCHPLGRTPAADLGPHWLKFWTWAWGGQEHNGTIWIATQGCTSTCHILPSFPPWACTETMENGMVSNPWTCEISPTSLSKNHQKPTSGG